MKIILRISMLDIVQAKYSFNSLEILTIGLNIINNPKIFRVNCPITGDAIFFEED